MTTHTPKQRDWAPNERPTGNHEGADLRAFRKALHWTQRTAARNLQKNIKTIQRYESGETPIPSSVSCACAFFAMQSEKPDQVTKMLARFRKRHGLKGFIA